MMACDGSNYYALVVGVAAISYILTTVFNVWLFYGKGRKLVKAVRAWYNGIR